MSAMISIPTEVLDTLNRQLREATNVAYAAEALHARIDLDPEFDFPEFHALTVTLDVWRYGATGE